VKAPDSGRLRDVKAAAAYLGGISTWTISGLVACGVLNPVRIPSCRRPGEFSRRLLFDVKDLDALIDSWKAASSTAPNAGLSQAALEGWRRTPSRTGRKPRA
jgi:hypothetical protein